jgi:hypothetical protein
MLNETHIEKHEVCIKCQLLFLNDFRSQIRKDILPFLKGGQYPGMGGQYDPEWGGQYDPEYAPISITVSVSFIFAILIASSISTLSIVKCCPVYLTGSLFFIITYFL